MYEINPYQPPQAACPAALRQRSDNPLTFSRSLAIGLAIGGVLWGLFFAFFILLGAVNLLFLGLPGYLITWGYLARARKNYPVNTKRIIWGSSAMVQGGWLLFALAMMAPWEYTRPFMLLCLAWWTVAAVGSALALFLDR